MKKILSVFVCVFAVSKGNAVFDKGGQTGNLPTRIAVEVQLDGNAISGGGMIELIGEVGALATVEVVPAIGDKLSACSLLQCGKQVEVIINFQLPVDVFADMALKKHIVVNVVGTTEQLSSSDFFSLVDPNEDAFSADDAYFVVNGAKMQLKEALKETASDQDMLIDSAISSLVSVKAREHSSVLGYRYCLAMLCLHFWEKLQIPDRKCLFGAESLTNIKQHGLDLMLVAANPKAAGGDDDYDAAYYLQYKQ